MVARQNFKQKEILKHHVCFVCDVLSTQGKERSDSETSFTIFYSWLLMESFLVLCLRTFLSSCSFFTELFNLFCFHPSYKLACFEIFSFYIKNNHPILRLISLMRSAECNQRMLLMPWKELPSLSSCHLQNKTGCMYAMFQTWITYLEF